MQNPARKHALLALSAGQTRIRQRYQGWRRRCAARAPKWSICFCTPSHLRREGDAALATVFVGFWLLEVDSHL
jgi:hypothetical protein